MTMLTPEEKSRLKNAALVFVLVIIGLLGVLFLVLRFRNVQKPGPSQPPGEEFPPQEIPPAIPDNSFEHTQGGKGVNTIMVPIRETWITSILANVQMAGFPNGGGNFFVEIRDPNTGRWSRALGPMCLKPGEARDVAVNVSKIIDGVRFRGRAAQLWECPGINPFNGGKLRRIRGQWFTF